MSLLIWAAITGCQQVDPPTVSYATAGEIDQLLSKAESVEALGEPVVDRYEHEDGITFVHKQPLLLQGGGIGPVSIEHCCTGSCKVTTGTIRTCKATGCATGGKTCGTITCTGGCVTNKRCAPCNNTMVIRW